MVERPLSASSLIIKAFVLILIGLVLGCSSPPPPKEAPLFPPPAPPAQPPPFKPITKKPSPFAGKFVTLTVKDAPAQEILYALAQDAGLNLVFERGLNLEETRLTVAFHNMPLEDALNNVLETLGLFYKIKRNSLFITAFADRIFNLSFLATVRESRFSVGGDVLGGGAKGGEDITTPLTGSYQIEGQTKKTTTDIYTQVENVIKTLISKDGKYSLNRLTGLLYVRDHRPNMERIAEYIQKLKMAVRKQVLLEAKVIEVHLYQNSSYGIDWSQLNNKLGNYTVSITQKLALDNPFLTATIAGGHFSAVVNFLETFGRVRVLSNPRIRTLTGQPAMISVGKSISYLKKVEITTESTQGGTTTTTPEVEISSIFDGILLGVTPYVEEDGTITMSIVPIKSELESLEEKKIGENTYTLPQVNLREASTVVRARSGDLVVLGGLIGKREGKEGKSIPGLSKIPIAGNLFKQQNAFSDKVELVILIKPILLQE